MITRKTAGKVLSEYRDTTGMTLESVSKKTGIAIATLIKIEHGKTKPQAATVHKLWKLTSEKK